MHWKTDQHDLARGKSVMCHVDLPPLGRKHTTQNRGGFRRHGWGARCTAGEARVRWGREFEAPRGPRPRRLRRRKGKEWGRGSPPSRLRDLGIVMSSLAGSRAEPPPKTDFRAFQASQNACCWDVCRKLTSCQKTFVIEKAIAFDI